MDWGSETSFWWRSLRQIHIHYPTWRSALTFFVKICFLIARPCKICRSRHRKCENGVPVPWQIAPVSSEEKNYCWHLWKTNGELKECLCKYYIRSQSFEPMHQELGRRNLGSRIHPLVEWSYISQSCASNVTSLEAQSFGSLKSIWTPS